MSELKTTQEQREQTEEELESARQTIIAEYGCADWETFCQSVVESDIRATDVAMDLVRTEASRATLQAQLAEKEQRVAELEKQDAEEIAILEGTGPFPCRNDVMHERYAGCLYCKAERAEQRVEQLERQLAPAEIAGMEKAANILEGTHFGNKHARIIRESIASSRAALAGGEGSREHETK